MPNKRRLPLSYYVNNAKGIIGGDGLIWKPFDNNEYLILCNVYGWQRDDCYGPRTITTSQKVFNDVERRLTQIKATIRRSRWAANERSWGMIVYRQPFFLEDEKWMIERIENIVKHSHPHYYF